MTTPLAKPAAANWPALVESAITALTAGAATITLDVPRDKHPWAVAVEFYTSAAGTTVADPTAGTATVTYNGPLIPTADIAPASNSIDYSSGKGPVTFSAHADKIKVVMASISGGSATHCRARAIGSRAA